jgi:hypothetical protein
VLAIAGLLLVGGLAGALVAPRPSSAWVSVGGGIGYAGPYVAYGWGYPGACAPPVAYYPPVLGSPPVVYGPPVYAVPPLPWPGYGPNVAVRWNRYFTPDGPRVHGYTFGR